MIGSKKPEIREVVPKSHEPKITLGEAHELRIAIGVERDHYRGIPSDDWTVDMHVRECAYNRLWLRVFTKKHPSNEKMNKRTEDEECLTRFEWQTAASAAEIELRRLGHVRKECWLPGHLALKAAYEKILEFLISGGV